MKQKIKYYIMLMILCFALLPVMEVNADDLEEDDEFSMLDEPIRDTHLYPNKIVFFKDGSKSSKYENVEYHIENNQFIIQVPYSVSRTQLKNAYLQATIENGECVFSSPNSSNGKSVDLTSEVTLTINMEDGRSESYKVSTEYLTGDLPVLYITTDNGQEIDSRTEYVSGNLVIDGEEYKMEVRGRGNVSWWGYSQHGYMIKLEDAAPLLGFAESDKFCILSTYGDTDRKSVV